MAWYVITDGVNDALESNTHIIPSPKVDDFSVEVEILDWASGGTGSGTLCAQNTASSGAGREFQIYFLSGTLRFYIAGTVTTTAVTSLSDGVWEFIFDGSTYTVNKDGVLQDSGTLNRGTAPAEPLATFTVGARHNGSNTSYSFFGASKFRNIKITTLPSTLIANFDTDVSSHSAGTVTVDETISGSDLVGINMPTDGSAWYEVGGGISIAETLKNINYSSLDSTVTLTGSLLVTESLVNANYTALNSAVTLTGVISITEQLKNTNYTSLDSIVDLTGLVDVIESTVNTNYTALWPTITLTAGVVEITEQTVNTQYNTFNPSILLTPEPLGIVSTVCFHGVIEELVFNGVGGNVVFNGPIISNEYHGDLESLVFNGSVEELLFSGKSKALQFNGTIDTTC